MSRFPTPDEVAAAIVAAARETGADPLRVVLGQPDLALIPMLHETSRARAYAAWALKSRFPEAGPVAIGRMVGCSTPKVYLSSLRQRQSKLLWWDREVSLRVKAAVDASMAGRATQPAADLESAPNKPATPAPSLPEAIPAFLPSRPAVNPGKRDLLSDLRRAVENTARLPTGE